MRSQGGDILTRPDAVIFRAGRAPERYVRHHTVAMIHLAGSDPSLQIVGGGTGVLVQIEDRFFVLSAGHCIEPLERASHTALIIQRGKHRFTVKPIRFQYRNTATEDFGFMEVSQDNADKIQLREKLFLTADDVEPVQLSGVDDWFVVSGYPVAHSDIQLSRRRLGAAHLAIVTTPAGCPPAPETTIAGTKSGSHLLSLWIPPSGILNLSSGRLGPEVSVPPLRGMSGGGCWRAHARPNPTGWDVSRMRLCAIHEGSLDSEFSDEAGNRFTRAVSVSCHLHLIAQHYPGLVAAIGGNWPALFSGADSAQRVRTQ